MSSQIQATFISSLYEWPFVSGLIDSFIESTHNSYVDITPL